MVIDFSQFAPRTSIYIENRLEQNDGRGPTRNVLPAGRGNHILRFDVVLPAVEDSSRPPPYAFYELPTPTPAELARVRVRRWRFERDHGAWTVNGRFFDCDTPGALIPEGDVRSGCCRTTPAAGSTRFTFTTRILDPVTRRPTAGARRARPQGYGAAGVR